MKVTIFGTGYVGLVQGAVLADVGHDVMCVDVDATKVAALQAGRIPIHEPGLQPMVQANQAAGRLHFTTNAAEGVAHGDLIFLAVGTPPDEDGSADLQHVLAVARTIARHMAGPKTIVNKSTVPVGTADKVAATVRSALAERGAAIAFEVVSNPEFLKEGAAVADCKRPDRIVIGTASATAERQLRELYSPFNRNHDRMVVMDVRSAELTKYAANAMLATKISFINEIANLAERLGADIESVRRGIGSDPRIGYSFIYPGAGYGGSCFPKDVKALIRTAQSTGFTPEVLLAVDKRNDAQREVLGKRIVAHYGGSLRGKTIAVWGLAFKPETDDMREAPSRNLLQALWAAGAQVRAHDPAAMDEARRIFGERADLALCASPAETLQGADCLAIVTEWKIFRVPDFEQLARLLKDRMIFDGRNLYEPEIVARHGLDYYSIGRPTAAVAA
ncbi:UDP-glucose/GDP-mannose dehydrogenase family protein [Alicycliphilus denitrificans]|uniref:UDP-glucose 6-dehydrogenase n=1 Tax=Alicycliphilus denitrificans TaxID=179636 RepID=A0A858ZP91_9BURK|nr:UDP-glucose/GDP-mannose dehydrogenase family protein [Alicycliphilus denitrificans]ADU98252.1 nucleotide sugar dehydrogenase [Alicycliphilus denitrificans BC]QKD42608.1 UDP-glucose/GDP-mannose dehydrogenase family protein [Alicycliphilus denitrificans]